MVVGTYEIPAWVSRETRLLLQRLGVYRLFEPQYLALEAGVERGENLVVASPTGSGKTLVSLIGIVNRLSQTGGRAFYLVPLRSVAHEKYSSFSILEELGFRVKVSVGDYREGPPDAEVVIATYEKFDSLLRVSASLASEASIVVIDEIHSVSDPKRGPILESLVARLLYTSRAQILGMSATIPNAEKLAEWIGGRVVFSPWRPVPLKEYVFKGYRLYPGDGGEARSVERVFGLYDLDLSLETLAEGGQVLVFTSSRRRSVSLARRAAKKLGARSRSSECREHASRILSEEGAPRSMLEELASIVENCVAYHHAGLPPGVRKVVEDAYREGAVKIIYSTPTLAAGVNLPARRVIIDSYYRYERGVKEPIRIAEYKQMAGRAGRPGLDEYGEAVIVAEPLDSPFDIIAAYIRAPPEPVESRFSGLRGLRHFILGSVASSVARSVGEIKALASRTLYNVQYGLPEEMIHRAIEDLESWGLVEVLGGRLDATRLGRDVSIVYLDPESVPVFRRLEKVVDPDSLLDVLFLVSMMPDMVRLPVSSREEERLLEALLDASPRLLSRVDWLGPEEMSSVKTALILKLWVEEASEDYIYGEWRVHPGDLLAVVDTAEWISSALARISRPMGLYEPLGSRLRSLSLRIKYGVREELLPLVAIPGVGRIRARILYNAGYRSLEDLASAEPGELARLPLIGTSTVRQIMEFVGRHSEAREMAFRETVEKKGLLAFLDNDPIVGEEAE